MICKTNVQVLVVLVLTAYSSLATAQDQCQVPESHEGSDPWGGAALQFNDDFESARLDVNHDSGFQWGHSVRATIVRDDQFKVWHNGPILKGPEEGDWSAHSGSHSLRFRYLEGASSFAEQRFFLGNAYPEIWIGYWVRIPQNWEHGTGNTNNKFFAIWMDEYEFAGPGATGVIQIRNDGNGNSLISPYALSRDNHHPGEELGKLLIRSPEDQGRWMQVVIHAKMASGPTNADGIFEMYRRWEGDPTFENIFSMTNWENYHVGGNEGFAKGYLMGWANATQPEETEWLLDDFVVSTESLLSGQFASSSPGSVPRIITPAE